MFLLWREKLAFLVNSSRKNEAVYNTIYAEDRKAACLTKASRTDRRTVLTKRQTDRFTVLQSRFVTDENVFGISDVNPKIDRICPRLTKLSLMSARLDQKIGMKE